MCSHTSTSRPPLLFDMPTPSKKQVFKPNRMRSFPLCQKGFRVAQICTYPIYDSSYLATPGRCYFSYSSFSRCLFITLGRTNLPLICYGQNNLQVLDLSSVVLTTGMKIFLLVRLKIKLLQPLTELKLFSKIQKSTNQLS